MAHNESEPRNYLRGGRKRALAIIAIIIIAAVMTHKGEDTAQQPAAPTTNYPRTPSDEKPKKNIVSKKEHKYSSFVEKDAIIEDGIKESTLVDAAILIRENGWKCDSISYARFFLFSRGIELSCNKHRYDYEVRDRGGNWVATLK